MGGLIGYLSGGDFDDIYYGNTPISPDVSNLNEDVAWWSWGTKHFTQQQYCAKYVGNPTVIPPLLYSFLFISKAYLEPAKYPRC